MSIDLERSLEELALSVRDDALADRMNGQVYRMVAQIKRRRAARYTGTSVIGMSAAAAVVVGGVQLARPDAHQDSVATNGPDGPNALWPACGEQAPIPEPTVGTVSAVGAVAEPVPYGEPVGLSLDVVDQGVETGEPVGGPAGTVEAVVVQDGVVVATGHVPAYEDTMMPPNGGTDLDFVVELAACAGDTPLEGGDYTMFARVTLAPDGGDRVSVTTDAMPFTIGPNPLDQQAAGLAAVDDIVASADDRADEFGVCGSVVPPDADAPVTLELRIEDRVYAAGESISTAVLVEASDKVPEGAQLTANRPSVVLTRDGVIVARGDAVAEVPIDVTQDGVGVVVATGSFGLCSLPGTDAPSETPLPAGTYQAYAVFTLTVDVTGVEGAEQIPWEPVVVRSAPVDVTIG